MVPRPGSSVGATSSRSLKASSRGNCNLEGYGVSPVSPCDTVSRVKQGTMGHLGGRYWLGAEKNP
jgi:hypothetical protein